MAAQTQRDAAERSYPPPADQQQEQSWNTQGAFEVPDEYEDDFEPDEDAAPVSSHFAAGGFGAPQGPLTQPQPGPSYGGTDGFRSLDSDPQQPTLAELEQLLNQTMAQLNMSVSNTAASPLPGSRLGSGSARAEGRIEPSHSNYQPAGPIDEGHEAQTPEPARDVRVPSNKDLAFGMGAHDGPFDISDIWAMESQPSASQPSASQVSHSEQGAYRDDDREVNSYAAAYSQQYAQSSADLQASLTFAPGQPHEGLPGPGPGRGGHPGAPQQPQQPQPRQQHPAGGPGHRPGRYPPGRQQADAARRQPVAQQHPRQRPVSAAQGTRQRPEAHQPQQQQQSLGGASGGASGSGSPSGGYGQRPRSAYGNVSPRYNQPPSWAQLPSGGASPRAGAGAAHGFPFRPAINQRSRELAERMWSGDRDKRLEQLSRPRNERLEERFQQIRQAKEAEELADCTFQPRTGRPPSTQRTRASTPVHERLFNVKPAWQQKRDEILREREQAALASCSFQPHCGTRAGSAPRRRPASAVAAGGGCGGQGGGGASAPYVPIHQRVADLLRSRNEKLAKAQLKAELDGGSVTFQPEVNRRSLALAAERQRQAPAELAELPAHERLYLLAQEQRQQQSARRSGAWDDLGSSYGDVSGARDQRGGGGGGPGAQGARPAGPVPAINPRSRALAESSDLPQDFLARQASGAYLAALGHEKRALYRSLLEESTCTFQPQLISSRGGSLTSSGIFGPGAGGGGGPGPGSSWSGSGSGGEGSTRARLDKLAYGDAQRSVALREALAEHHYGQFTFQPQINERSRQIGRRHSLAELYRDDERHAKLERLAAQADAARAAECTFAPAINRRSASLGRSRRRGSLMLASVDKHEQASKIRSSILMEAKALKEYEELKECTFTPAINRTAPKPAGPVPVPGLGRHLELKELARRKREAEEARKAEVWNLRPKSPGPPRGGPTVPQPFSFENRVLPWEIPKGQASVHQQQAAQQQQTKAITALKQQRQQQRKDADDRRSAQLQRIMLEAEAVHGQNLQAAGPAAGGPPAAAGGPRGGSVSLPGGGGPGAASRTLSLSAPGDSGAFHPPPPGAFRSPSDSYGGRGVLQGAHSYGGDSVAQPGAYRDVSGAGAGYGADASPLRDELRMRFH
ncbi:hypothetical protein HYH03_004610 [Edaphochlamys debaryana]|uniref:Uncharacterized protein n=1 Tax=Edaphochlamys debaryana TaxID=47281 RepID=A0A836C243_9CHLO|nr:hypothetical protein HYH03_004610 [Edaphochlamys debaryana]|eukprot:KAG2497455.1 hypothetical protein HYH03_004610 [Edaphochlamys debaryana]